MPSREHVIELAQSRADGESHEHFYARETRQKIDLYLEASNNLGLGKEYKSNSEVMYRLEAAFRHARFMLTGAVQSLNSTLNVKPAPNGAEEIKP